VTGVVVQIKTRPAECYVAAYHQLPHPGLGPMQEFALDVAISANAPVVLTDVVWRAYDRDDHVAFVRQRLGEAAMDELTRGQFGVAPGLELVLPHCYFLDQGAQRLSRLRISVAGFEAATRAGVSASHDVPLLYHEQRARIHLPFAAGAWWAITGSDWASSHKTEPVSWPFAYDFVRLGSDGRTFAGDGQRNEDHYSYGEAVLAPAGGKVVLLRADMHDQAPGASLSAADIAEDPTRLAGNVVVIGHGYGEFSYLAHLQAGSITVKEGQMVKRGQRIAAVGNSGHSPGPHLHYHLQDGPSLFVNRGIPVDFHNFMAVGDLVKCGTIPSRMIVSPALS
jgi:murein DD-endopeptidase MepM/ murein hydrolase activator NlpD